MTRIKNDTYYKRHVLKMTLYKNWHVLKLTRIKNDIIKTDIIKDDTDSVRGNSEKMISQWAVL